MTVQIDTPRPISLNASAPPQPVLPHQGVASGSVGISGFEKGEFEGDSPTEEVAAQIRLRGADPVQLRAQEVDKGAKTRIVMQRYPVGVHEVVRRGRRAGGPVEIEPLSHDKDRKRGGIAPGFGCLAHDSFEARGRLCIGVGRAPVLGDLLLPNQLKEEAAAVLVASGAV